MFFSLHLRSFSEEIFLFHSVGYKNHSVGYIFHSVEYKSRSVEYKSRSVGQRICMGEKK